MNYLKEHYGGWPDRKLPALDGRTPREAIQDRVVRPQVLEILRGIENGEERKKRDGKPYFDVGALYDELGVKDHER